METATRTKYHSLLFEIKHINMLRSICARSNTDTMFNKINARVRNSVVGNCFFATKYIVYYSASASIWTIFKTNILRHYDAMQCNQMHSLTISRWKVKIAFYVAVTHSLIAYSKCTPKICNGIYVLSRY